MFLMKYLLKFAYAIYFPTLLFPFPMMLTLDYLYNFVLCVNAWISLKS